MWAWQNDRSGKDPLEAWKKMKKDGKLEDVYDVRGDKDTPRTIMVLVVKRVRPLLPKTGGFLVLLSCFEREGVQKAAVGAGMTI